MYKKVMSTILPVMILAGLIFAVPASVSATSSNTWAYDNFESYADTDAFKSSGNWSGGAAIGNTELVTITGYDGNPTKALKVVRTATTPNNAFGTTSSNARLTPLSALGSAPSSPDLYVQEMRIYFPEEGETGSRQSGLIYHGVMRSAASASTRFYVNSADSVPVTPAVSLNTWVKITAVYDVTNSRVITYMDDELYYDNTAVDGWKLDLINRIEFYNGTIGNSFYMDDVNWYVPAATTVTSVLPADNATGASVGANVELQFSEKLLASTVTDSTVTVTKSGEPAPAEIEEMNFSADGKTLTLLFADPLDYESIYDISVSGVEDMYGQPVSFSSSFETAAQPIFDISQPVFKKIVLGSASEPVITKLCAGLICAEANVTNNGSVTQNVFMMVCLKKDDALEGFVFSRAMVEPGMTWPLSGGFSMGNDYAEYTVEVYIWDSIAGMIPLAPKCMLDSTGIRQTEE